MQRTRLIVLAVAFLVLGGPSGVQGQALDPPDFPPGLGRSEPNDAELELRVRRLLIEDSNGEVVLELTSAGPGNPQIIARGKDGVAVFLSIEEGELNVVRSRPDGNQKWVTGHWLALLLARWPSYLAYTVAVLGLLFLYGLVLIKRLKPRS